MELFNYISKDDITVDNQKTVEQTLRLFTNISCSHVPVVENGKLLGNIAKEDLMAINDGNKKIEKLTHLYEYFFTKEQDTLLEIFGNFSAHNTNVMPVINSENNYLGYLDLSDALDYFANTDFLNQDGNILLLEKNNTEFSMSEICQIVETNNSSVLGCFIAQKNESRTNITLKVKPTNINEIIQSLRRYEYTILNNLTEDTYLEDLKNRSEYFIKFLKI